MARQPKPRGRPVKYPLPEPIDATPEEIAQVVLKAPPKKVWRFEQEAEAQGRKPPRRNS